MTTQLPHRSKTYVGPMTNTNIWSEFPLRAGDVIVSTPPKSGTTWTQSIVAMLIFAKPGMDKSVSKISPWLDAGFRDQQAFCATLAAQTHRRGIKSHAPFDGISYDPKCTYFAVYRHPMDVHFSMRTHVGNMKDGILEDLTAQFPDDVRKGFRMFVKDDRPDSGTDFLTVSAIVQHFLSFRKWAHLPNVHLFHYADLSRNLGGEIARMADVLGLLHSPDVMQDIIDGASFGAMKRNAKASQTRTTSSVFRDEAAFFSTGTSGKWQAYVTDADVQMYHDRIARLLSPEDVQWLEHGAQLAEG